MFNDVAAALALDNLPIGAQVGTAYIDDKDDTATIILFERREHESPRHWWDMTRRQAWWTAAEIARAHDDMVVTANPDHEVER